MASNTYIEFDQPKIEGEVEDSNHKNQIGVLSWSHGFSQPTSPVRTTAGGGTVEMANHQDFSFSKYVDGASDDLMKYCWNGKHIGKAVVHSYRADGDNKPVKYLEITMEKVVVSNVSVAGGSGDIPIENVSLSYGKVTYKYIPQKKDGTANGAQPVSHDLITREVS